MSCVKYNNVIDVSYEPVDPSVMPVSLDDMKRHLYLLFDTEGGFSVDDDDTYIETELIPAAVVAVEKYTGRLLRPSTVTAIIRNEKGGQHLPYGPITQFSSLSDEDGNAIESEDYKIKGLDFKYIQSPCYAYMTAVYEAGYTTDNLPSGLRMAILHQGAFLCKSRGDQQQEYASSDVGMSASAKALANPYRRVTWLL